MSEKALKCGFCLSNRTCMESSGGLSFWVQCDSCEARGPVSFAEENAVSLWNRHSLILTLKMKGAVNEDVFTDLEGSSYPVGWQADNTRPLPGQKCTAILECMISEDNEVLPMLVVRFVDED